MPGWTSAYMPATPHYSPQQCGAIWVTNCILFFTSLFFLPLLLSSWLFLYLLQFKKMRKLVPTMLSAQCRAPVPSRIVCGATVAHSMALTLLNLVKRWRRSGIIIFIASLWVWSSSDHEEWLINQVLLRLWHALLCSCYPPPLPHGHNAINSAVRMPRLYPCSNTLRRCHSKIHIYISKRVYGSSFY